MHHETEISQAIEETTALPPTPLGPTGRFPGGKLTDRDKGELAFAVSVFNSKVIINFGRPITSLGMSAREAKQLATLLRQKAAETKPKKKEWKRQRKAKPRAK
jgi:hypothetical protein